MNGVIWCIHQMDCYAVDHLTALKIILKKMNFRRAHDKLESNPIYIQTTKLVALCNFGKNYNQVYFSLSEDLSIRFKEFLLETF